MNQEVKQLWIADLRANPDLQGKNALRTQDGKFCCYGRLCELAVKAGVIPEPIILFDNDFGKYGKDSRTGYPPKEVMVWAELPEEHREIKGTINGYQEPLSVHNDTGATYAQIADAIENEL